MSHLGEVSTMSEGDMFFSGTDDCMEAGVTCQVVSLRMTLMANICACVNIELPVPPVVVHARSSKLHAPSWSNGGEVQL